MNQNQLVKTNEIEWKPLNEEGISGIYVKPLLYDKATRRAPTILLKLDAGATYPLHNHPGGEEVFVLEGDIQLGKDERKRAIICSPQSIICTVSARKTVM